MPPILDETAQEAEPVHFGPDADLEDVFRTLNQLADELPGLRRGKKFNVATLYRWRSQGLQTVRLGSTICSTRRWVNEFIASRSGGNVPAPAPRSAARRTRDLARVDRELAALGV